MTHAEMVAAARLNREQMLADPQRPVYHFATPEGICAPFDPNGAIYWKGLYHLYYIFKDERGFCWGHVSSNDLVHWRFHPTALFPSEGDPDKGIFSGNCFINKEGNPTILYHGVGAGNCIAISEDAQLDVWKKLPFNPIVPIPPKDSPEAKLYGSWDPCGWVENGTYYAIFGGAKAALFRARNLTRWEYLKPFMSDVVFSGVHPDDDVSCPGFFKIGDMHMLLCISHKRGCRYYLGRWENEQFHPECHAWMNWPGGSFFAPESLLDGQGRRIMWAWVVDYGVIPELPPSGWSGMMSLPRHLWLDDDHVLHMAPVKELQALRYNHRHVDSTPLMDGKELLLNGISGDCLELDLTIQPGQAKRIRLTVRQSPNGEEETPIVVDRESGAMRIELGKSSLGGYLKHYDALMFVDFVDHVTKNKVEVDRQEAPFVLKEGEPLRLRVFLDRSIIEIFANERQAMAQRIDPSRNDSLGISLCVEGGDAELLQLDAWDMVPSNPW